jgi:hypothetical protein
MIEHYNAFYAHFLVYEHEEETHPLTQRLHRLGL